MTVHDKLVKIINQYIDNEETSSDIANDIEYELFVEIRNE